MAKAIKTVWQLANLAPTGAAILVERAGATERTKAVVYWTGWLIDWTVPGLPVGSGLVALGATIVILAKRCK